MDRQSRGRAVGPEASEDFQPPRIFRAAQRRPQADRRLTKQLSRGSQKQVSREACVDALSRALRFLNERQRS